MSEVPESIKKKYEKNMKELLREDEYEDPKLAYVLDKTYLGHALIVNNIKTEMPGSQEDVKALTEAYSEMGFKVKVESDCDKKKMEQLEDDMMIDDNHEYCSCFMLTILTHGDDKGGLMIAKETPESRCVEGWNTEHIVEGLNGVETLTGKPKLLVIFACRGKEYTEGQRPLSSDTAELELDELDKIPDKADFYIAYGTVPGYIAPGPGPQGSFYLRSLAKHLKGLYKEHPIDTIFTCVKRQVSTIEQHVRVKKNNEKVFEKMKQCLEDRNSLRYLLKFSEFKKPEGAFEMLEWISGPKQDSKKDTRDELIEKYEKRIAFLLKENAEYKKVNEDTRLMQEEMEKIKKESMKTKEVASVPESAQADYTRELTDLQMMKLAKVITNEVTYVNLAIALGLNVGIAETHRVNNPHSITTASYKMLQGWRRSVATPSEEWRLLNEALKNANLSSYMERILEK